MLQSNPHNGSIHLFVQGCSLSGSIFRNLGTNKLVGLYVALHIMATVRLGGNRHKLMTIKFNLRLHFIGCWLMEGYLNDVCAGGGTQKADERKGCCMFVTVTSEEGVPKSENFADVI